MAGAGFGRDLDETLKGFASNPPNNVRGQIHQHIREEHSDLVSYIFDVVPECPERTLALRALQESMMWANMGLAMHYPGNPKD